MRWPENNNEYQIIESDQLEKSSGRLNEAELRVYKEKLTYLSRNPRHPSLSTKPLHPSSKRKKQLAQQGVSQVYEFYINRKQWRCILYIYDEQKVVYVVGIMNHGEVIRHMK